MAPRIFLFLFAALFGGCVVVHTCRSWGSVAASWVGWIFGSSYVIAQGYSLHTEQFCAFFGFLAVLSITGPRRNFSSAWFEAGMLIGAACLFKQVAVFYAIGIVLHQFFEIISRRSDWQRSMFRLVLSGLGFALVLAAAVVLMWRMGIVREFYRATFVDAIGRADGSINLIEAAQILMKIPAILLTGLSGILLMFNRELRISLWRHRNSTDLVLVALIGSISLYPSLKSSTTAGHYVGQAVCFLSIGSAVILGIWTTLLLSSKEGRSLGKLFVYMTYSLLAGPCLVAIGWGSTKILTEDRLRIDLAQMQEIRKVLAENLPEEERVLCISSIRAAQLYYMSGRRPSVPYAVS